MKYLNKIVFINSADRSLKYAEVSLDGNVHFIGTQGVGKSTLLRAILFFYNADKLKLGIAREKKSYDEYYFPYTNSYIIYEVQTDTGCFCVLTFKSQGRVAFRFLDAAYDRKYFITPDGKVFETWDKIREAFGKQVYATRIVSNYEEYRNILYGNNRGLDPQFRKYCLMESRQYQNIPRTISNVFLNTKLDAEFVKETIIKSLNEEDVKIDLQTYVQGHLRNFETELRDIKLWTDRNRNGENQLEKLSGLINETYNALRYLESAKKELAHQLGWVVNRTKEQLPMAQTSLHQRYEERNKVVANERDLNSKFEERKDKLNKDIGRVTGKLDDIKTKRSEYAVKDIEHVIARVDQDATLKLTQRNLLNERSILTSKYQEIDQQFNAQLQQLDIQLNEYRNVKVTEQNEANRIFIETRERINQNHESACELIRQQHQGEVEDAKTLVGTLKDRIYQHRLEQTAMKSRRFYEKEIDDCAKLQAEYQMEMQRATHAIELAKQTQKNQKREWESEEKNLKDENKRKLDALKEQIDKLHQEAEMLDARVKSSANSFYAWLNEHVPDWDKTIGKVIDEEHILFRHDLNPRKTSESSSSLFGITIDTGVIDKSVKTIDELNAERNSYLSQMKEVGLLMQKEQAHLDEDLGRLRKRMMPKIKEQQDIIDQSEYKLTQLKRKQEEVGIQQQDWLTKAEKDKGTALADIDQTINSLTNQKIKAEEQEQAIAAKIKRQLDARLKEKEQSIRQEQDKRDALINESNALIGRMQGEIAHQKEQINQRRHQEMSAQGADVEQIARLDSRLSEIDKELQYIDAHRDLVAEYNKDKRELFDREAEYKQHRDALKKQLDGEQVKYNMQAEKIQREKKALEEAIRDIQKRLDAFQQDLEEYDRFCKSELFKSIEPFVDECSDKNSTMMTCKQTMDALNSSFLESQTRYQELQERINKFVGHFTDDNLFSFKVKLIERNEYLDFAAMLNEFVEEHKIDEYKTRFEERFAHIIHSIGNDIQRLMEKEGEISQVIHDINNDFVARNFVGAIKSMELRTTESSNSIYKLLVEIKTYNDENTFDLGIPNLFSTNDQSGKNSKAIELLQQLVKAFNNSKVKEITLSDSFELQFRIVENDNDTNWVEKLSNVGSDGTDILVKAMINIMLLNVFKSKADKKNKGDFRLHCMMDEIGKLHPNNVKGILQFANDRNILLINSSPTSFNPADYKRTYLLSKDTNNMTTIKLIVAKR